MINQRGIVYTFYSFKGGVGRSMALANTAALLAKKGNKVLIVDWDLEAPGLEKYFSNEPSSLSGSRSDTLGIVDLIDGFTNDKPLLWRSCLLYAYPFKEGKRISILSAGQDSIEYVSKLQNINWEYLFTEKGFGLYLEQLREEWLLEFDFILIDSRTGITDIGGICTIHLPDALILFFTANEQSVSGVIDIMNRVWDKFKKLPLDRSKILALPIPSRFENTSEYKLANKWKSIFAQRLSGIYKDWLPDKITATDVLEKLFIPNIPFWSFGEGLPVVSEGTSDPRSLGFAYDILARLLSNRFQWNEALTGGISLSNELPVDRVNDMADSIYNRFDRYDQVKMKDILLRLVEPSKNTKIVLQEKDFYYTNSFTIIDELITSGLLFRSSDTLTGEPTIEISQESTLLYWQKLQSWIKENREFLVWRHEIGTKAKNWEENGHDRSELLAGGTLKKAVRLLELRKRELNDSEIRFINRSVASEQNSKLVKLMPYFAAFVSVVIFSFLYYNAKQNAIEAERATQKSLLIRQRQDSLQMNRYLEQNAYLKYTIDSLIYMNKRLK